MVPNFSFLRPREDLTIFDISFVKNDDKFLYCSHLKKEERFNSGSFFRPILALEADKNSFYIVFSIQVILMH